MKTFVKRAECVKAVCFLGDLEQLEELVSLSLVIKIPSQDGSVLVPTLSGNLNCKIGDYIVEDEKGNRSVSSCNDFNASYLEQEESVLVLGKEEEEVK